MTPEVNKEKDLLLNVIIYQRMKDKIIPAELAKMSIISLQEELDCKKHENELRV